MFQYANNNINQEFCGSSSNNFNNKPQAASKSTDFNASLKSNPNIKSILSYQDARKRANEILQKSK